ncbi:MAG: sugar phosphate nucleotidyltransferase [Candidatus Krumholzibacteriales bacterium]
MKAVIPAAGIGKRLRPHTYTRPKALVSVAGRPMLGHIIDSLIGMGVDELIPIIGYQGDLIRDYINSRYSGVKSDFVVQEEQKGIAHAVNLAREYADNSEVIIILGDTIIETDFNRIPGVGDYVLGVREVDNPGRFGIVEAENGIVTGIEEKPDQPKSNLAIVGLYYLKDSSPLFEACGEIIRKDIRTKGEYQITDALGLMIEQGTEFKVYRIEDWYDCGKIETLLETNRVLLDKDGGRPSRDGSLIIPPCAIADNCVIERSLVGPYVSVSEGCEINSSVIDNSIIEEGSRVSDSVISGSVLGSYSEVIGYRKCLNISDNSTLSPREDDRG